MNLVSQKLVKIRKPHNCWGCTELFKPPAEMMRVTSSDGDEISSVYWCEKCQKITYPDMNSDDTWEYGEFGLYIEEQTDVHE